MPLLKVLRPTLPILIGASIMLTLSMGLRQSLGIFMQPLTHDVGITISEFTLAIAVQDQHWDVLESERVGADGKPKWTVKNAAFTDVKDPEGKPHRVPGKSRLTTPSTQKADLTVDWHERTVNLTIDPEKFKLTAPAGLPTCAPPR